MWTVNRCLMLIHVILFRTAVITARMTCTDEMCKFKMPSCAKRVAQISHLNDFFFRVFFFESLLFDLIDCFLRYQFMQWIVVFWNPPKSYLNRLNHGQSSYWTAKSSFVFLASDQPEGENLGPKLRPRGGFFGPWIFIILKNSHQDLSNEGSNFILSALEVGHWAVQTQQLFDKFHEISDFGFLQQSQNRARFWIC